MTARTCGSVRLRRKLTLEGCVETRVSGIVAKSVLSISYDSSLLITRQMLLQQAGYAVISALGFTEALERCRTEMYDIVLMGHSMPRKDKSALAAAVREHCSAPILSIRRHGDPPLPEADYSVEADEGPTILLAGIEAILDAKEKKRPVSLLPYRIKALRN
jgi:CheY-like chemotaxis protein